MRMYDLVDENNVLFDKQTIRRYNNKNNNYNNSSNRQDLNNNQSLRRNGALFKSRSFSQLHRKIINNITPNLHRRGQHDKDMAGVSLMTTTSQKNGVGRLKKKFSGDASEERRRTLKGMTRYRKQEISFFFLYFMHSNFQNNFIF